MEQNDPNQPNVTQAVPFLRVRDMDAAIHFYVDGLGFTMTKYWIVDGRLRWCWLELGGAAIMLQDDAGEDGSSIAPGGVLGEGVSISFQCRDALALYREFTGRGIAVSRPFVGNNAWVIFIADPDGYRLEFESLADAPEGTEYEPPASARFS